MVKWHKLNNRADFPHRGGGGVPQKGSINKLFDGLLKLFQLIFSVKNDGVHKIWTILGIKIKVLKLEKSLEINRHIIISELANIIQRTNTAIYYHQKAFAPYKAAFRGKTVILVAAGPTVNYFEPIEDAIYVGCNRAFLLDKVKFDFLFSIDKIGIEQWYEDFFNYRKNECIKFIGDQNFGKDWQIPENKIPLENTYRYITYTTFDYLEKYNLDIATQPLHNTASVATQAMQFILYTQPSKIYIVGTDCTASTQGHFKGNKNKSVIEKRGEDPLKLDERTKYCWHTLKDFADIYYPDTEIISINPVGLKGLFKDVYTKSYLASNPQLSKELGENITILNTKGRETL